MKKMLLSCTLLLLSCEDVFQTHPYDVDFKGETRINVRQTAEIERRFADSDTLRVAFISDTHLWHSDARDEVADINRRENIDFVIHCGDLTDTGTTKEYEWSRDILGGLRYPFVALVGNHDFLGTSNDLEYLKNEMKFARNRIERLKLLSKNKNVSQLLAPFMKDLCAKFPTYEDLVAWHKLHHFDNAGDDFFAQHGL